MESVLLGAASRPHAVVFPFPLQGHMNPLLMIAKILHHRGFHITYVVTEINYARMLKSRGSNALKSLPDFQIHSIPDGLPPSDPNLAQDLETLITSLSKNGLHHFRDLVTKLNNTSSSKVPPISCMIFDGLCSFGLQVSRELGVPDVTFWPCAASSYCVFLSIKDMMMKGHAFTRGDETSSSTEEEYRDSRTDWKPRLEDQKANIWESKAIIEFLMDLKDKAMKASATFINTFEALEGETLEEANRLLPHLYSIGPLHLLTNQIPNKELESIGTNLWKEDDGCIRWLDSREPSSVLLVCFGSTAVLTSEQLSEFAWGLANSKHPFLWIIRPDIVVGDSAILPQEFYNETKHRSFLASWCAQEQVLNHPSIAGFLTHCGWNSIIESICSGVPMLGWPFYSDQPVNCRYMCVHWGIAKKIDNNVDRNAVEKLVRDLMNGEEGKLMKKNVLKWKKKAEEAITVGGSTYNNLNKLVDVLNSKYQASFL